MSEQKDESEAFIIRFSGPGEVILLEGPESFVLTGQPSVPFPLCIEYPEGECCQTTGQDDIVAVAAPEGGPLEPALMLLELVRLYHVPLIVLPRGHPGSRRLRYIVSAGSTIHLHCGIQRGTHPEQYLLCAGADLSGMVLEGRENALHLHHVPDCLRVRRIESSLHVTTSPPV
ncbi:MAG: alpha/beta hydrolase [Methanoregulaceae archaeon]|jgi:hypothetical protein|nr:alpha/beta hydrolase [Methanoregulaceae archaeon]